MTNYLFLVEGEVFEFQLLEECYGRFGFVQQGNSIKKQTIIDGKKVLFEQEFLFLGDKRITIMKNIQPRLYVFLKNFQTNRDNIENLLDDSYVSYSGIFYINDVDHTTGAELWSLYSLLPTPENGLLLPSNPCIEAIGDTYNFTCHVEQHVREYKKLLDYCFSSDPKAGKERNYHADLCINIISHLKRLLIKNTETFQDQNVLDHPGLFVERVSTTNSGDPDRTNLYFDYLSTVLYVSIAYVFGITKREENACDLLYFLEEFD